MTGFSYGNPVIRNNAYKSNKDGKQFRSAFDWDQQSFSLPLHEKLTIQHLKTLIQPE